MNLRLRKLIGMLVLLVFMLAYVGLAVWFSGAWINDLGVGAQMAYYVFAGFLWVFPAFAIIRWSSSSVDSDGSK